ncbi:MAG: Hpt domain-containing protein [Clostridia bacterium]|nr:Hpt domain-containing protein [Clostridia bacterium]
MLTVEKLKEYGADVETGLSRCANNEALYLRLVKICIEELSSSALGEALEAGDLERAFDIAHKLKGGVTNLALEPVSVPVCEITELLRNKTPGDYGKLYGEITKETDALVALMN